MTAHRVTEKPHGLASRALVRRRTIGVALMLLSLLTALKAQAADEGLQLRAKDGAWQDSVALETDVDFRVRGLMAEVTVTQRYRNDSGDWLEGRYLLPLPENAAVGRLRLKVGERLIEGEVREKAQARAIYQAAAAQGQRAGLVEQARPNLFRTAVANIGPGETVEVQVGYWQPVRYADGEFSVHLPLTLTPPYTPSRAPSRAPARGVGEFLLTAASCGPDCAAPTMQVAASTAAVDLGRALEPIVTLTAEVDAGVPLAEIGSLTHHVDVQRRGNRWHVALGEFVATSDREFELRWRPQPSTAPRSAVFTETVDGEHYALLMVVPPTVQAERLPRELILVIDNSGSMHGQSMQQAIAALDAALSRLGPEDRFNIVRFNHTAERLFPESPPAAPAYLDLARRYVQALRADGGTEMAPALELAFATRAVPGYLRQIVLATDAGIGNADELFGLIESRRGEARLFPVGIGSAPNGHFLRKAGELGRGAHVTIRDLGEVAARMDALFAKLDRPALRDLDIAWPTLAETYPERVPDLYHGEPLQLVARVAQLGGEVQVRGHARQTPWTARVALTTHADGAGVGRLWGRARIESLEDALRGGMPEDAVRPQIVETALRHQLVSRYTSLVAVERAPARPSDAELASAQFANATPDSGLAYAQGSTSARALLGLALTLALMSAALLRRRA